MQLDGTVLITGDLHGSLPAFRAIIERSADEGAHHLIIAGDLCPGDDPRFSHLLGEAPKPFLVRGNCDSTYAFSQAGIIYPPRILQLSYEGRTILLTHGDLSFDPLHFGLARGDIVISGHTHVPLLEFDGSGILYINGGSPALPRSRWGETYARVREGTASVHRVSDGSCCFSVALIRR